MTLRWTTTRPQQLGWYWWRFDVSASSIVIYFHADGIDRTHGEWAGPLEPPEG